MEQPFAIPPKVLLPATTTTMHGPRKISHKLEPRFDQMNKEKKSKYS